MARSRVSVQADEWVDLTRALLAQTWLPRWHLSVLPYLSGTFQSAAAFNWVELDQPNPMRADIYGAPAGWPLPEHEPDWNELMARHHPLLIWYARTGADAAMASRRVPQSLTTARDLGIYRDMLAPFDLDSQISIPLYVRGMDHRAFVIGRGADFSPQEQQLALLIQPLLRLLYRQSLVVGEPARTAALRADLTGQELAVIRLLARGFSAREIATRLSISERTAHKHLQNAYRKLSAHDRVTALAAAAQAGLLTPEGDGAPGWDGPAALRPKERFRGRGLLSIPVPT